MSKNSTGSKIGYMTALVIIVASTIGAGIFFKNGSIFDNSHGSLGLAIASWVVSAIGVMAIGLALIETSSASKNDKGVLAWVKNFAPKWVSKYSANYILLIYMPLNYVAMPLYAVMSIQDATNDSWMANPWVVVAIAFAIFAWISTMGFFGLKYAEKLSWVFTVAKFLPLIIAPFITLNAHSDVIADVHSTYADHDAPGITHLSGWLGIMASIPAIMFAYDGFYTVTSLKSKLKDPKKMGSLIAIGVALITAGYLFFAILTGMFGQTDIMSSSYSEFTIALFNSFIFIAVIGIINGFAMSMPRMYLASYAEGDFNLLLWFKRVFKIKSLILASFWITIVISLLLWVVVIPVGIYAIKPTTYVGWYGDGTEQLYELADLLTNFTSMAMFMIIGAAIAGTLWNRRKNTVEVKKYKFFVPVAWIAVIFTAIGSLYFVANNIALAAGMFVFHSYETDANGDVVRDALGNGVISISAWDKQVAYIVQLSIMIFTLLLSAIPMWIPANNKEYTLTPEEQNEVKMALEGQDY